MIFPENAADAMARLALLSKREREVLESVLRRGDVMAASKELFLSVQTVRTHLRNARAKLGVHTTLQAVAVLSMSLAVVSGGRPPGITPHSSLDF